MKMKAEHYNHLEHCVKTKLGSLNLTIDQAINKCIESGYSPKAARWYLLHGSGLTSFVCKTLYEYLNDEHIDTALRVITNTK